MKRFLLVFLTTGFVIAGAVFLFSEQGNQEDKGIAVKYNERNDNEEGEEDEKEDGIREAQEMDFEMTKDVKLGYVPVSRLVKAFDDIYQTRKAGRYARISSLVWTERGPNTNILGPSNGNTRGPGNSAVVSGRMRAVHVDLSDATNKTVWAASVSGGLWKTTDITASPANWVVVNDFFGNLAISSICQNPVSTNIMYFATGERNGNIDAVRGGGVWKSTDNGANWSLLANTTSFWNVSKIVCDAAGNVYVGTNGNNKGLQRSTDGGATWVGITPATSASATNITDIKVSSTGRMHVTMGNGASTGSGSFYTDVPSTVTSATWNSPVTPIPNLVNNCELAVAGDVVYALPEGTGSLTPQIYKSSDGGINWFATTTSPPSTTAEPSINTGQAWYDLALGVDPANPNVVVAGGLNIYRTVDGGATWTQISRWVGTTYTYVHADHHGVFWNGSQVLVSSDGGIFYSSDNGLTYTDRNVGIRTLQFYSCAIHPTSSNYFLGGTQDNGSHSLSSAGLGGSTEVHGGDGGYVHIDEDEPNYQFSATTRSQYRRSINGGVNWSSVNYSSSIGQFINPTDYDDINNIMYTSAGAGTYVRWDNATSSSSFTTVSVLSATTGSIRSLKVSPYTNNRVFMGSGNGAVIRVDNAHTSSPALANITGASMPQANGYVVTCVNTGTDDNNLIATYSNYGLQHVWVTSNGGTAWTNISGNLPDIPVRWAMFYPEDNDKAIIATDMGIFETDDINGASTAWVQNSTFPNVRTDMLQYRTSDRTILAATHGRGMWTSTFTSSVPYVRFASAYNFSFGTETKTATGNICRNYKDYTIKMRIDKAPAGTANLTFNVAGGTAVQGVDFDFTTNGDFASPSSVLSFPSGSTAEKTFTLRIYDDAEIENAESLTLSYTVGSGTDAVAAPSSSSYTFTISDNDVAPVPSIFSGTYSIGTYDVNLSTATPFRSNAQRFRIQYLYTAAQLIAAGVPAAGSISSLSFIVNTKNSTKPYSGFTIAMGNTSVTNMSSGFPSTTLTQVYSGNYSSVAGTNTFEFSTPFAWDGVSNIVLNFCFDNGSAATDAFSDVMEGMNNPLGTGVNCTAYSSTSETSGGCTLSASFLSASRLNITFTAASGNPIATALNSSRSEAVFNNGNYHFYNLFEILNKISNASASLGCVSSTISEAGNTWQSFYSGQRAQKVFNISVSQNAGATYTLGIYYSADELASKTPSTLKIVQTTAASASAADISNSTLHATTATAFGTGYLFTATVTGGGRFFVAEDNVSGIFDVSRRENFVKLLQNPVSSSIQLYISNQQREKVAASLFTNNGQLIKKWDLGRADTYTQVSLGGTSLSAGVYLLRIDEGNKTQTIKIVKQ
ncbi:MAG: T9SS type A sorting domain-containing protein [Lacibacter sp.]